MECKEVERLFPSFFKGDLTGKKLMRFSEHIEHCEECKEELTIQYLSSEGIARLEEGKTFDLDRELNEYRLSLIRKCNRKKYIRISLFVTELIFLLMLAGVFTYVLW